MHDIQLRFLKNPSCQQALGERCVKSGAVEDHTAVVGLLYNSARRFSFAFSESYIGRELKAHLSP